MCGNQQLRDALSGELATWKPVALRGVLVMGLPWVSPAEQVTVGGGWFLGTNQGGYLWLEPKP